ncbi:extracellular solute-binding protein [Micromonospora sp. R77]|uniref:extracellular solute-binding protein n=1 Tax=Micromonospora sp. R77 TaxID=2925836 RepID=UPI001F608E5E|nr:extracellular solute-binding protein [Micromonospora sp. R77]MCI4065563.1 extracellular solute-binding protein [Micromonospora sp. R77]
MTTPYSRRSFLTGVVATGLVSAGATFLLPGGRTRSKSLDGRPRLCTGTDLTGARAAVIGMWNEAHPDATVDLHEVPGGSRAERDAMVERIRNGAVDIVNLDIVDIREFAKEGYLQQVRLPTRTYFPAVEQVHRVAPDAERYWAVPFNSDVGMLFSRVTAGLELRRPLLPQVIRRDARGVARFVGQLLPDTENDTEAFVVNVLEHALSTDAGILAADGTVSDDPGRWQDALAPLRNAVLHNDVVRARNEEDTRNLFEAGLTHMRNWPARYRGLRHQVDLLPLPAGILGGQSLALVANAANVETSLEFIRFATSEAAQRVTAAHGLAPALTHAYDDPLLLQAMPHLGRVQRALEQAVPRPTHRRYRAFAGAVRRHVLPFLGQPDGRLTGAFTDEITNTLDPGRR